MRFDNSQRMIWNEAIGKCNKPKITGPTQTAALNWNEISNM